MAFVKSSPTAGRANIDRITAKQKIRVDAIILE
jgi:hypothetical protein